MDIQTLNDFANDYLVSKLEIANLEKEREKLIATLPSIVAIDKKLNELSTVSQLSKSNLIVAMKANNLKSWKTNEASFSKTVRYSANINPLYKKQIEKDLKEGQEVYGWELKESEYISITPTKI